MRRALIAVMLLAVPVLGGFECTVELWAPGDTCEWGNLNDSQCSDSDTLLYCGVDNSVDSRSCADYCAGGTCISDIWGYGWCDCPDIWEPGVSCDYWNEYPGGNFCYDPQTVRMCSADNVVIDWNCATACPSGVTGYCEYDASQGGNWCMCPDWAWAPGYSCDYWSQYDETTCDGAVSTYCAETNVIGSIDCVEQCTAWYGAGATATCEHDPSLGYNGCICEIQIETCFDPYCYDGKWYVDCDPADTSEIWWNCDEYCVDQGLGTMGVCKAATCVCG